MTITFREMLEKMGRVLEHHAKYLRQYADNGEPPPNDEDYEVDDEEYEKIGALGLIAEDLQVMGDDLERLVEKGSPGDESE